MTRAKRVDNNQAEIVAEFRRLGWEVIDYSDCGRGRPDIEIVKWIGFTEEYPRDIFWDGWVRRHVEIKNGNAGYTTREMEFMKKYRGLVTTVRSIQDVKELFG